MRRSETMRISNRPAASVFPTSRLGLAPGTPSAFAHSETGSRDHPTRPPSCRTAREPRPLAPARSRRFEWSAWGTQEFLRRGAQGPQSPGPGQRPDGFDREERFGAAEWLTLASESSGAVNERERLRSGCNDWEEKEIFYGDIISLDF